MASVHILSYLALALAVMAVPLAVLDRVLASRFRRPREQPGTSARSEAPAGSQSMSRSTSSKVG
jgi:hypothetical protein